MSRAKDILKKNSLRAIRKKRVRGSIPKGTAQSPRVTIFKSNRYLSAQAIDDVAGVTLVAVNSKALGLNVNKANAVKVAAQFAENLKAAGIETVVFDRNGYLYHGVIASFADALRDNGIKL
ncbi:50S ribosomal protein L18 [Halarcobacter ebronensis]|uniref:Large ribosomal subunit protein uL18 n=1 Tax=Halarcobacter ebronensis TaxID=1462615 RepID=A0A4Q0YAP1_9BACT|nr:50S ribosomal protein L18 [Halarcobacter ebronensis]RXJ67360.1 50S ribosomal protein L18 [Halarcobacter ebronensis]